jgi:hypothetical protein
MDEERRQEIRTLYDSIPEAMKNIQVKSGMFKNYTAITVDISSLGLAFVTSDLVENDLTPGQQVTVHFDKSNSTVKANIVYSYPIADSRVRIGVIFKDEKSMQDYYKFLQKSSELEGKI